jgi:hypothetical protein
MAVTLTEKELEERCRELLQGEEILATGAFQPYGSGFATGMAAGSGAQAAHTMHAPGLAGVALSAAAGYAAHRGMAKAEHQPPWTVLAVTPTHVYAFDATDAEGLTATRHFSGPPYASWDRSQIVVHVSRHVTQFTLSIDDPATSTSWEYTGNQIYKVGGKLVAKLLTDGD